MQYLKNHFIFILLDVLIPGISYFCIYWFKNATLAISIPYEKLLFAFYGGWIFLLYVTRKYRLEDFSSIQRMIYRQFIASFYLMLFISFMVVVMKLTAFSRFQIYATCILIFLLESLLYSVTIKTKKENKINEKEEVKASVRINIWLAAADGFLLILSVFLINIIQSKGLILNEDCFKLLSINAVLWFTFGIFTGKFRQVKYRNMWYALSPVLKSIILMTAGIALVVFIFRIEGLTRFDIFIHFLFFGLLEVVSIFFYFILFRSTLRLKDIETIDEINKLFNNTEFQPESELCSKNDFSESFLKILEREPLNSLNRLFNFIVNLPKFARISESEIVIQDTKTLFNIHKLKNQNQQLYINLHQVNDFTRLNEYFLEVYQKLKPYGFFISKVQTIRIHREEFFQKYPKYFAELFYLLYFFYKRVFPKLPFFCKIYFVLSGGEKRVLSKAETLGRLCFCGFTIAGIRKIDGYLYFIARKSAIPSIDKNPSYGPIIRLKRVGMNNRVFNLYKFRTMYPYSEYLQEYIYEQNKLSESGKIMDDFRITEWGKVFRKFWLDELPQIINYLKGDLNIIGVRALSLHYFGLYPKHVQKLRTQVKNGLIPPYYADMPRNFNEIVASEERYLLRKLRQPLITDWIYFFKAFNNIVFKSARSR